MSRKTTPATVPAIPRPGEAKRGPEGHLGYLLRQASAAFRGATDRALTEIAKHLDRAASVQESRQTAIGAS